MLWKTWYNETNSARPLGLISFFFSPGSSGLDLSSHGAGHAAELGVVLVGAVLRPDDQLAVGEVGVVHALGLYLNLLNGDCGGGRILGVAVAGLAGVGAGVRGAGVEDGQAVGVANDLEQEKRRNIMLQGVNQF